MSSSASRNARRQASRMSAAEQRLQEADRSFFRKHPHRNHLVRPAAPCEMASAVKLVGAEKIDLKPGFRLFAIVRQVHPGARLKTFRQNLADTPVDLTEEQAQQVYEAVATSWHHETEAKILQVFRQGSALH